MVVLYLNATCTSRGLQGNKFSTAAVAIIWLFDSIVTQDIFFQASMHSLGGETYQLIILFDTEHTIILHLNCWLVGCGPDSS
jgi:hypothetical protein